MANFVTPPVPLQPAVERIIEFKGLNRKHSVEDGEMPDMLNLTSDNYPLLTPRKPRGEAELPEGAKRPIQLLSKFGKLAMIAIDDDNGVSFFYDGQKVDDIDDLNTGSKAVAINNKICFFPQMTMLSMHKDEYGAVIIDDYASLESEANLSGLTLTLTIEDARITLPEDYGFKYDDAVNIEGTLSYTGGTSECNVSCVIEDVLDGEEEGEKVLILPLDSFIELVGDGVSSATFTGTSGISRTAPLQLDHVIEWNNRLWGCSNLDNTIYACKLGDPTNWQYFQSTSLDSFYAEQGTDEDFTGVAEYSGHIIFFKPNSMCRIYGTAPSNYQVTNTKCYGIEEGSARSAVTINDTVFYKSEVGIMAYQGGVPYCISDKFNSEFRYVVAGTEGRKYYASCLMKKSESAVSELMVLDIDKGLWHKEDGSRFFSCATINNRLYYGYSDSELLYCDENVFCDTYLMVGSEDVTGGVNIVNPLEPTESAEDMEWMATFGPFDEYLEEHKIYSKLALRLIAKGECSADVFISINEGEWEQVEHYEHVSTKGDFIPIIPRRCDRYSVKIEGKGPCEMKSLTRRVRQGSFGRL